MGRWAVLLLLGEATAFGGLNQLTSSDVQNIRNQERNWNLASVGTRPTGTAEYSNGHFNSEYPEEYIVNGAMSERANTEPIIFQGQDSSVPLGRRLDTASRDADAEKALLEAAKAEQSMPASAGDVEEIDTPALMTEV